MGVRRSGRRFRKRAWLRVLLHRLDQIVLELELVDVLGMLLVDRLGLLPAKLKVYS